MSYIFEKESFAIRGAIFEVYKDKGPGFLEDVYQECLEIEFADQNIPFSSQQPLDLTYKNKPRRDWSLSRGYIFYFTDIFYTDF